MNFKDFNIDSRILDAIKLEGYTAPTPIQEQTIPFALSGKDILGCAQTGTGKTAAFAVPILHRMTLNNYAAGKRKIRALILTPTRELALQIEESFKTYGRFLKFSCGVIMGGVNQSGQEKLLKYGVDILVATPGRLLDLSIQGYIDLRSLEFFVLDEADRMLDMGFINDVKKVINLIPSVRQTLFFTATMPLEVAKLAKSLLVNPIEVAVNPVSSTVDLTEQVVYFTDKVSKPDLLINLLQSDNSIHPVLIFTRTKYGADKLSRRLQKENIEALAIHGDKSQMCRQTALNSFKQGKLRALVATDIASRGLDIEDLPHVINYELPEVPETYVHRIGRTGRAGKKGSAISFCDFDEKPLLVDIEKLINKKIIVIENSLYPMTNFVKSPPKQQQKRPSKK